MKRTLPSKVFPVLLLLLLSQPRAEERGVEIRFFDVGEGDAALIRSPSGSDVLVDTGNFMTGYHLANRLETLGIRRLDRLILTHLHPDHAGGVFALVPEFSCGAVHDNGYPKTIETSPDDFLRWYARSVREHQAYSPLRAGNELRDGSLVFEFLWPPEENPAEAHNLNSLVFRLRFGTFSALFAGDLVEPAQTRLLESGADLRADVLKVAHHGSRHATSEAFLERVSPEAAVISVNAGNVRGYPSSETIALIRRKSIRLFRTDRNGDIRVTVRPDGRYRIEASGNRPRSEHAVPGKAVKS